MMMALPHMLDDFTVKALDMLSFMVQRQLFFR